jgi:hypothetical protein
MLDVSGGSACSRFEVTGCRHVDILCLFFEIGGGGWALMVLGSVNVYIYIYIAYLRLCAVNF